MKIRIRSLYILIMLSSLAGLLLPGCGSSKSSGRKSDKDRYESTRPSKPLRRLDPSQSVDGKIGRNIVGEARRWLGTPYAYGGKTRRKGTDCSGMIMVIFEDVAKVKIPRNSARQQEFCMNIDRRLLEPGDLVFFSSSRGGGRVSHVGIYIGENNIIHASSSKGVIVSSLDEKYYATHFHSAGRVQAITYASTGRKNKSRNELPDFDYASSSPSKEESSRTKNKKQKIEQTSVRPSTAPSISLDELIGADSRGATELPDTIAAPSVQDSVAVANRPHPIPAAPADTVATAQAARPSKMITVEQPSDSTSSPGDSIRSEVRKAMRQLF